MEKPSQRGTRSPASPPCIAVSCYSTGLCISNCTLTILFKIIAIPLQPDNYWPWPKSLFSFSVTLRVYCMICTLSFPSLCLLVIASCSQARLKVRTLVFVYWSLSQTPENRAHMEQAHQHLPGWLSVDSCQDGGWNWSHFLSGILHLRFGYFCPRTL